MRMTVFWCSRRSRSRSPSHRPAHVAKGPNKEKPTELSRSSCSRSTTSTATSRPSTPGSIVNPATGLAVPAGGAEYFATHMQALGSEDADTYVVSAGDLIGGSPLLSGLFHDEPTIEFMNSIGLDTIGVGNHEFDEGRPSCCGCSTATARTSAAAPNSGTSYTPARPDGCHPVDGCQDGTPFFGSVFQYLAANVDRHEHGQPAPARRTRSSTRRRGEKIAVHRRDVRGHAARRHADRRRRPRLPRRGRHGQRARARAEAAGRRDDRAAPARGRLPERAVLGAGSRTSTPARTSPGPSSSTSSTGSIPTVDVVVSAHTHAPYICTIDGRLVTSASSFGRLITTIDLTIDRTHERRRLGDRQEQRASPRRSRRTPATTELLARYKALSDPIANRVIGTITADIRSARDTPSGANSRRRAADGRRDRGRPARRRRRPRTSAAPSSRS